MGQLRFGLVCGFVILIWPVLVGGELCSNVDHSLKVVDKTN
jgi:hypothetical protein